MKDEEVKISSKLSDQLLGDSQSTHLSDHSDEESVKSEAEERRLSLDEISPQTPTVHVSGCVNIVLHM